MNEARIFGQRPSSRPKFVLYWMQQAQRVEFNPALDLAAHLAAEHQVPLRVVFVLTPDVPEANLRHYLFLLQGLAETAAKLAKMNIGFHLCAGEPHWVIAAIAGREGFVVMDRGYLRWQRNWRDGLRRSLGPGRWLEVEGDVVVPVETVSGKEEYAAATIRGKILKRLEDFLEPEEAVPLPYSAKREVPIPGSIPHLTFKPGMGLAGLQDFCSEHVNPDLSVDPSPVFKGGHSEAKKRLGSFLENHLQLYAAKRNDPSLGIQSGLSPYLHFGQISSLEVALAALEFCGFPPYAAAGLIRDKSGLESLQAGLASFLEELIVRRELSCNFCWFNPDYDNYACIPLWARQSLNDHLFDARPALYGADALEHAATDDPYWNAAQKEMTLTGKMHNYMRMYWGKKIIEWTPDPETAFQLMLWLNNKYQLDGRDPNSFAGIAWCFGKHDRPWQSRAVFGSVRYMNAAGLKRKFDLRGYLDHVASLEN